MKPGSVGFHKRQIIKALRDHDVHDGQRKGTVGPRPDQQNFVRLSGGLSSAHINRNDLGASTPSRDYVAGRIWLAGDVCAPKNDHL
jgi:hypothetical protein